MDTTILEAIFAFLGASAASGITWDLIKSAGKGLLDSFEKRFFRYFKDKLDAVNYLQDIAKKESYNRAEPLKDAEAMYNNRTGQQDSQEFINEFEKWLKENKQQFSNLVMTNVQKVHQRTNECAKITTKGNNNNIGNITNN